MTSPWDDRRLEAAFAMRASTALTAPQLTDETLDRVRSAPRPAPSWQRWLPAATVVLVAVGLAAGGLALSGEVVGHRLFREGPTADLRTFDNGEFAFEYPAAWLGYDASTPFSGGAAIAVIGTQPIESRCGDERHIDINCVSQQRLEPGHVRLYVGTGSYRGGTIQDRPVTGRTRVQVGGMPALFAESDGSPDSYYREDKSLHWEIARPGSRGTSVVELEARLTEPGVAERVGQLEALIASFRFSSGPDPSPPPTPEPTPTATPPRLADLRVMTVEELIAAGASPTADEVIVYGWLRQMPLDSFCPIQLEPHPLIPNCAGRWLFLTDRELPIDPASEPSAPHLVPMLPVDAHRGLDLPPDGAANVQVIGHMLDHRWPTCPADAQIECKRRFVIDRVVPADQPIADDIPEPWTSPSDHPVGVVEDAVEVVSSVVGGVTVLSIGVADMESLRSIEPQVEDINNGEGAWVIRALVGGDAVPVARTFLVGHIGWWTLFEVTESGLVDRSPPVEGAPSAAPTEDSERAWPPYGVLDVPMPVPNGACPPNARCRGVPRLILKAGVVDRTGLLVKARSVQEGDPDRPIRDLQAGEMAIVQVAPDTVIAHWDGSLCDDRTVLTVYGHGAGAPPNRLELRGERGQPCRLALIHYGFVLRFSQPVDADLIRGWNRVGTPFEAFPPVDSTVVVLAKDGGFALPKFRAALIDLSGRVTGVRAPKPDEPRVTDPDTRGPVVLVPDPEIEGRYHLYWTGGNCDGDTVVAIDPTFTSATVEAAQLASCDAIGVERRLIVETNYTLTMAAAS